MDEKPYSLAEVIRVAMSARLADVHTAIVARVARVNLDGDKIKSVDAQPMIKVAHTTEDDKRIAELLPVVVSVPVQFPSGGGYRLTFPVKEGDTGLLLFTEASLDLWLEKGGDVDPGDDRRFSLADAVFVPGVRDFMHGLKSAPIDRMTLGKDDGLQIHIAPNAINVGSNLLAELDKVPLSAPLKTFLSNLIIALAAHLHPTPAGPSLVSSTVWPTVPNFESSTVNVKK